MFTYSTNQKFEHVFRFTYYLLRGFHIPHSILIQNLPERIILRLLNPSIPMVTYKSN